MLEFINKNLSKKHNPILNSKILDQLEMRLLSKKLRY